MPARKPKKVKVKRFKKGLECVILSRDRKCSKCGKEKKKGEYMTMKRNLRIDRRTDKIICTYEYFCLA